MLKSIFNFFKKINLFVNKNKKKLSFLVLGLLLLLTPTRAVHAGIFDSIWNSIKSGLQALINLPINGLIVIRVYNKEDIINWKSIEVK